MAEANVNFGKVNPIIPMPQSFLIGFNDDQDIEGFSLDCSNKEDTIIEKEDVGNLGALGQTFIVLRTLFAIALVIKAEKASMHNIKR